MFSFRQGGGLYKGKVNGIWFGFSKEKPEVASEMFVELWLISQREREREKRERKKERERAMSCPFKSNFWT